MKLRPEQLEARLGSGLVPFYLVSGDEPLQVGEAGDTIRTAVRAAGAEEREVLHVEAGFSWGALIDAYSSRSLFSQRRLVELRLSTGKVGKEGGSVITGLLDHPNPDTTLLVISARPKPPPVWFNRLEKEGVHVEVWPVDPAQLPGWIGRRMAAVGLKPQGDAAQWLAERVEGNLLAARQEIDKLLLLQGPGEVTSEQIERLVADSARFDPFRLIDTLLQGETRRGVQMVNGLRSEGEDTIKILAALTWSLRQLLPIAAAIERGEPVALSGPMRRRQRTIEQGVRRLGRRELESILAHAGVVDRIAKGVIQGDAWGELLSLSLRIGGIRLPDQAGEGLAGFSADLI